MNFLKVVFSTLFLSISFAGPGLSASVFLTGDTNILYAGGGFQTLGGGNEVFAKNVFNGKAVLSIITGGSRVPGTTTATEQVGTITSANLAGKDMLLIGASLSKPAYTSNELSLISGFVKNGGSLFLAGEYNANFTNANIGINSILAAIGSSMRLSTTTNLDDGGQKKLNNLSVANSVFTAGVNDWSVAFGTTIDLGNEATALITGTAPDTDRRGISVAYQNLGNTSVVPLPAALPMLAAAMSLFGVIGWRRRPRG